jgi:CBS domain-containing protein
MEDREPAEEDLFQPISEVMEEPTSVQENSGLVRAFAFIHKHQLIDLPVVNHEGQLVGLASRVDIGRALLGTWWQCIADDQTS